MISPQFGQENLVASWPGEIILLQLVHTGIFNAALAFSFSDDNISSPLKDEPKGLKYLIWLLISSLFLDFYGKSFIH